MLMKRLRRIRPKYIKSERQRSQKIVFFLSVRKSPSQIGFEGVKKNKLYVRKMAVGAVVAEGEGRVAAS
jgi:hypothetical protein